MLEEMTGKAAAEVNEVVATAAVMAPAVPSSPMNVLTAIQFRLARKQLENDLLVAFGKRKRAAVKILAN